MAYSEAHKRATRKWNEANLDRLYITAAKGKKDDWREEATKRGQSLNAFVIEAVEEKIEREIN